MKRGQTALQAAVLVALAVMGIAAGVYILAKQPSGLPIGNGATYRINAELTAADGVRPGFGQPVDVAGVRVGQIAGVKTSASGTALLELEIQRSKLPAVYADARAHLEPITPLKDLQLALEPGAPPAHKLPENATIDVSATTTPVELSTLLSSLDSDTRSFVGALIASTGQGTRGQGDALRGALVALGPTTGQVRRLSSALAGRRRELARLVTNLARVTHAASRDGRLTDVVQAGNTALAAIARQDPSLRSALAKLPRSLTLTDRTLTQAASFADQLGPTVRALLPATRRLPATLDRVRTLSDATTATVRDDLRPFVRAARPLARQLSGAVPPLARVAPNATRLLMSGTYLLNELAYNPRGSDEGGLFWFSWFVHNWLTFVGTTGDAHGTIGRTVPFVSCDPINSAAAEIETLVNASFGLSGLCPK